MGRKKSASGSSKKKSGGETSAQQQGVAEQQDAPFQEPQDATPEEHRAAPLQEASTNYVLAKEVLPSSSQCLSIVYYENMMEWEVPESLLKIRVIDLVNNSQLTDATSRWLGRLGLSNKLGLLSQILPEQERYEMMRVEQFIKVGGVIAYTPEFDDPETFYRRSKLVPQDAAMKLEVLSTMKQLRTAKEKEKDEEEERVRLLKGKAPMVSLQPQDSQDWKQLIAESLRNEVEPFKGQVERLTKEVETLTKEVETLRPLKNEVETLSKEVETLTKEVETLTKEVETLRPLKNEVTSLRRRVHCLETTVNSAEALSKRRFLEQFRRIVTGYFPGAWWNLSGDGPDGEWWNRTISEPESVAFINQSSGQNFDVESLRLTRLDARHLQRDLNVMIHNHDITQAPEIYATFVCQYEGHLRETMMKIYRIIFGREATADAFGPIGCCRCPVHCPANAGPGGDEQEAVGPGGDEQEAVGPRGDEQPANAPANGG